MLKNIPFPKESYTFRSDLEVSQVRRLLAENLETGSPALTHNAQKQFLGNMTADTFEMISTAQKSGVFSLIKGRFIPGHPTSVEVDIVLNGTFRNLFFFWFAALTAVLAFTLKGKQDFVTHYVMFLLMIVLLRYIIGKAYQNRAEEVAGQVKDVLQLEHTYN